MTLLRLTFWHISIVWFLAQFSSSSCSAQGCNVVTVSGVPHECVRGACADGGCELTGDMLNGDYVRIDGVTNQMVDPLDQSQGQLPVYINEENGLYLFYDSFYAFALSSLGETEGWAIGESIGSACTDDYGYCRCGNVPAACCTTGPRCRRYLAKQSSQVFGGACQEATSYNRRPPEEKGTTGVLWKVMAKECRGIDAYETMWNVRGIRIRCKKNADDAPVKVELKQRKCRIRRSGVPDTDCRSDACQGCMYEFDDAGCQANVDSCQCSPNDAPKAGDTTSIRLGADDESSACTPCTLGRTRSICSNDAECCSGKCRKVFGTCGFCTPYKETCDKRCGLRREPCSSSADCCSNRCRKRRKICA